ncbi:MAG: sigma-70 family RNA polymerase sigma factor [Microvirga sp.]
MQQSFAELATSLRGKLHRYCARMAGSAIEGEDIVQDSLLKALEAFPRSGAIANPEAWLFRIAHNTALDAIRHRVRLVAVPFEEAEMPDADDELQRREWAAIGLRPFMKLSASERSSVILKDVVGYSLREIADILGTTLPAVKAALHRGRGRLTALGAAIDPSSLELTVEERTLLERYADRFNARDFDAVRDMLAESVHLDLVGMTSVRGRGAVTARYLGNYGRTRDWHFDVGSIDGRPALVVHDPLEPGKPPGYVVLLTWNGELVSRIRDFHHARYIVDGAAIEVL